MIDNDINELDERLDKIQNDIDQEMKKINSNNESRCNGEKIQKLMLEQNACNRLISHLKFIRNDVQHYEKLIELEQSVQKDLEEKIKQQNFLKDHSIIEGSSEVIKLLKDGIRKSKERESVFKNDLAVIKSEILK